MAGKNGGGTGSMVSAREYMGEGGGGRIGIVCLHAISTSVLCKQTRQSALVNRAGWEWSEISPPSVDWGNKGRWGNRTAMKTPLPLAHTGWRPRRCMHCCWVQGAVSGTGLPTYTALQLPAWEQSEEERGGGEAGKLQTSYDVFCNLISQAWLLNILIILD